MSEPSYWWVKSCFFFLTRDVTVFICCTLIFSRSSMRLKANYFDIVYKTFNLLENLLGVLNYLTYSKAFRIPLWLVGRRYNSGHAAVWKRPFSDAEKAYLWGHTVYWVLQLKCVNVKSECSSSLDFHIYFKIKRWQKALTSNFIFCLVAYIIHGPSFQL